MKRVRVESVGDGLCAAGDCHSDYLHADCGDGGTGKTAADALLRLRTDGWTATVLALSHFHADHANGFCELYFRNSMGTPVKLDYRHVYYPKVPATPNHPDLHDKVVSAVGAASVLDMLILAAGRWPSRKGSSLPKGSIAAVDVLGVLDVLCRRRVSRHPVCEGMGFGVGSDLVEVVWPPCDADSDLEKVMQDLVEVFDAAVLRSSVVRQVAEWVRVNGIAARYELPAAMSLQTTHATRTLPADDLLSALGDGDSVSAEEVVEAMGKLHNELSLAFRVEDRLLFLGDVTAHGVQHVVDRLTGPRIVSYDGCLPACQQGPDLDYKIVISPHHGTDVSWDPAFKRLCVKDWIVHSAGKRLKKRFCKEYEASFPGQNWHTHPKNPFSGPC